MDDSSFSFHVNWLSHSWDKAISGSDLETPRSWVWSKSKVIQSAQYPINSLSFHFTSIRPTIPEIQRFRNLTLKHPRSRSWERSKVKVTYYTQSPSDALPLHFASIGQTNFLRYRKFAKITVSYRTSPNFNQVITMTRVIKWPCFVVIWWAVLTISHRQTNFC